MSIASEADQQPRSERPRGPPTTFHSAVRAEHHHGLPGACSAAEGGAARRAGRGLLAARARRAGHADARDAARARGVPSFSLIHDPGKRLVHCGCHDVGPPSKGEPMATPAPAARPSTARASGSTTSRASSSRTVTSRHSSSEGIVGVTSNPTIFQAAIAEGDAYDEQIRELSAEHDDPKEIFWLLARDDIRDACDVLRPTFGRGQPQGRLGLARGRPAARVRRQKTASRGQAPARRSSTGPTSSSRSRRPRTASTRSRRRSRRHPGQRHADLLARAPPRGHPRVLPRPQALRRRRRRSVAARLGRLVLRLARRLRGRQAPRRDRRPRGAQGHARDRQRQARVPGVPGGVARAPSGRRWPPRARRRSGRCGPRPRPRTRPTAT